MDIHSKTLHIFKSFLDDLIKVFPEYKETIILNYSEILSLEKLSDDKDKLIEKFLNKIDKLSSKITERDESIFSEELFLLDEICFKKIWESDISEKTKDNIWKYLQSFCLININIRSNDKLAEALSDIEGNKKIKKGVAKDLDNYKKINEDYKKQTEEKNLSEGTPEEMQKFNDILENTSIGKIAKEVSEELNMDSMTDEADLSQMFNPENMMKIFSTISSKVNSETFKNGELEKEATNICGDMKDNPLFSQMMGMQGLFGNMMGQNSDSGSNPIEELLDPNVKKISVDSKHDPNKTKQRLQKKLADKKKAAVIKKED